jgi:hypothetical protein
MIKYLQKIELDYNNLIDLILSESTKPEEIINNVCEWNYKLGIFLLEVATGTITALAVALIYNYETLILSHPLVLYLVYLAIIILGGWFIFLYFKIKNNKNLLIAAIKNYHDINVYLHL